MNRSETSVKTYNLILEPSEKEITVKEGQTLLDAAIRNGIQIPYGCRHGSCAACKALVLDGEYQLMDRVSEYSLMSFEREEGYVLMCSTIPESDMRVEVEIEESPLPFYAVHDFESEVIENIQCTHDIHIIRLRLKEPLEVPYGAGQFLEIDIPEINETRAYSMGNPFRKGNIIEFHVKRIKDGKGSNYMCDLKVGDRVTGSGPYGKMQIQDRDKDFIFIAGGSGMAPIKALIEELFSEPFQRQVWFFYGARTKADLYLTDQWIEYTKKYPNFHFIPALSAHNPEEEWDGEQGFIAAVVEKYVKDMQNTKNMDAFLCGPPIMIETSMKALYQGGLKGSNIFYDEF